jgi:DNA-binding NarL/FixJ family response regulator
MAQGGFMELNTGRVIRVAVMHSEPLVSLGLVAALKQQADMDVQLPDAGATPDDARVIVTDYERALQLSKQDGDGRSSSSARLLIVSSEGREQEVRIAIEKGIHGYILQGCHVSELANGVRTLAGGAKYLCTAVAQRIAESLTRDALTVRETDVLHLVARGQCNKVIARHLDIAVGTVKTHLRAIMDKLDATSRTEAASIAAERGLLAHPQARIPHVVAGPSFVRLSGPANESLLSR